jgi:predicted nucleic acid-binding protein
MSQTSSTTTAYFDSSALVKRYLIETGTALVQSWCDDPSRTVAIAEIGLVEIAAAFAGKLWGGFITLHAYQNARADLTADTQDEYVLVAVDRLIVNKAIELTAQHRLRGYDAIHLACALHLNQALIAHQLPPLAFISADTDLLAAATAEGLPTDNPNYHS